MHNEPVKDPDGPLRIDHIEVVWIDDDNSSADSLGEYSRELKPGGIDRRERPEYKEHEHPFWNPGNYDPDHPEYALQDYERHEALGRGEWNYQGCVAKAVVSYSIGQGSRRLEFFSSGGLWGIESDSSPVYMAETAVDQIHDLKQHLAVFGIPWGTDAEAMLRAEIDKLDAMRKELKP